MPEDSSWKTIEVDVSDLLLDPENPRIPASIKSTPEEIRNLLLETEDIVEMAKSFQRTISKMPIERILVIPQGKKFLVVEGNRRTCTCQFLSQPTLIPEKYIKKFPGLTPEERTKFRKLEAYVAKTREETEEYVTRRHIEVGIKRWTPIAQQRKISGFLRVGKSPETIKELFGLSNHVYTRIVEDHGLLEAARNASRWTKEEKEKLSSHSLKPAAFTLFFRRAGVKELLKFKQDAKGKLSSTLPVDKINGVFEVIAKNFLLTENPKYDTRSNAGEVIKDLFKNDASLSPLAKEWERNSYGKKGKIKSKKKKIENKINLYFQDLLVNLKGADTLKIIARELGQINYEVNSIGATFLIRLIFEESLRATMGPELLNEFNNQTKGMKTLKEIINFSVSKQHDIFTGKQTAHLEKLRKYNDEYFNPVCHGARDGSEKELKEIRKALRKFLENLLLGTISKKKQK
jgi:hypothetical protein